MKIATLLVMLGGSWAQLYPKQNSCSKSEECDTKMSCIAHVCKDPCVSMCGPNAQCNVYNHEPECHCLPGYNGNANEMCTYVCGVDSKTALIQNGNTTSPGDFPWLAALYRRNTNGQWEQNCEGTLISPRIVLTAAHCIMKNKNGNDIISTNNIKVALGKYDRDFDKIENNSIIHNVEDIVVHLFNTGGDVFEPDISLIRLAEVVLLNSYIKPACTIWSTSFTVRKGDIGYVAGWGLTEDNKNVETVGSTRLQYIDYVSCKKLLGLTSNVMITHGNFCTKKNNGANVDFGDSGGGFTVVKNYQHFLVGIVSTRIIDEQSIKKSNELLTIFTDLTNYEHRSWVQDNVNLMNKAKCIDNDDCIDTRICVKNQCKNPCDGYVCGVNARCKVKNHFAACSCLPGFPGDAFIGCTRAKCIDNDDCNDTRVCVKNQCKDPCDGDVCGVYASCKVKDHIAACSCLPGYTGNPFTGCIRVECTENYNCISSQVCVKNKCENPCDGNVCGVNARCSAKYHTAICSCLPGYIGDPITGCTQAECIEHNDCGQDKICLKNKCVSPCNGVNCGTTADCTAKDHTAACSCKPGYVGEPFPVCVPDSMHHWEQETDGRYRIISSYATWYNGQSMCKNHSLQFARFNTAEEYDQLVKLLKRKATKPIVWIGATDAAKEGEYIWITTGQPLNYTKWDISEPSDNKDYYKIQDCVSIRTDRNYNMNDESCLYQGDVLCESH